MSSEERQRELREQGGQPGETQKQEAAKAAKDAEAKERAEEKAEATDARAGDDQPADEGSGRPRRAIRRRRRKKDEPADGEAADATADAEAQAEPEAQAEEAKQAAAEEEAEAEAAEVDGEPEPEGEDATPAEDEAKGGRRRGSEVAPAKKAATPAPRDADGAIAVRASAKYVRCAPRKARLVVEHIRGRPVEQARAILRNTPRAASQDVLKLLDSAIANAENNHELVADELVIRQAYVDEGPTLKRYRPRALGRATRIRKRTSHMTITLTTNDGAR